MDKKQMRRLSLHRWVWNHLDWLVRLVVRLMYGPVVCEPAPPLKGGYIVLPNHSCGCDQFLAACAFPKRHMYFLVSEHTFRKKLVGFFMRWLAGPISRVKGSVDAAAVLSVLRWLRQGVPVCIFPEGNRCWDGRTAALHPATAKLLKVAGVPVVTYRITGGYLADPRWSRSLRRGPIHGAVVNIHQPETLRRMSPGDIDALISEDLWLDACQEQRQHPVPYRGRRLAEGLEEALFLCPSCGGVGSLRGRGDVFACACGLRTVCNEYGFLEGGPFDTVAQWDDWQAERLRALAAAPDTAFSDLGAEIWKLHARHRMRRLASGRVRLDQAGLSLGALHFPLAALSGVALCHFSGKETVMFSSGGDSYELRFRGRASRRKYQLLLECLMDSSTARAAES